MASVKPARRRQARRDKAADDRLPPLIRLTQKQSGKEKRIATGFAWDLFLFAGVFGVPLFWRRLPQWGATILALWCLDLLIGRLPMSAATVRFSETALFAMFLAIQLWLGIAGNRLTAKAFLTHGWSIDQPNDLATKRVIERWKLAGRA
jgi:hypothetical protein